MPDRRTPHERRVESRVPNRGRRLDDLDAGGTQSLSVRALAEYLLLDEATLRKFIASGALPVHPAGADVRITMIDARCFVDQWRTGLRS